MPPSKPQPARDKTDAAKASAGVTDPLAPPLTTRVVKVGGSLLGDQQLVTRLTQWLDAQSPCATLLVVGGGQLADGVRTLDARHGLPTPIAHEQAIRAMQVNAFVLSYVFPETRWLTHLSDWNEARSDSQRAILDPLRFLKQDDSHRGGASLPCGWHVTSDSIAARVASLVGAVELVLLKSALPTHREQHLTYAAATAAGYVDAYFPTAAKQFAHTRAVNLRHPAFAEIDLVRP